MRPNDHLFIRINIVMMQDPKITSDNLIYDCEMSLNDESYKLQGIIVRNGKVARGHYHILWSHNVWASIDNEVKNGINYEYLFRTFKRENGGVVGLQYIYSDVY